MNKHQFFSTKLNAIDELSESNIQSSQNLASPQMETGIVTDSEALEYSQSNIGSFYNTRQQNDEQLRQLNLFFDQYEKEISIDDEIVKNNIKDFELLQQANDELKSYNQNLININERLQSENNVLLAKQIENLKSQELLKEIGNLKNLNQDLQSELTESQDKQNMLQDSYNRLLGQVKDIFKKQRTLIDENQDLHQSLMDKQIEFEKIREKLVISQRINKKNEKVNKEPPVVKYLEITNLNTNIDLIKEQGSQILISSNMVSPPFTPRSPIKLLSNLSEARSQKDIRIAQRLNQDDKIQIENNNQTKGENQQISDFSSALSKITVTSQPERHTLYVKRNVDM